MDSERRKTWRHLIRLIVSDPNYYAAHVDYVHINPLKHGLVRAVRDWPYSTFHRLVAVGVYPAD